MRLFLQGKLTVKPFYAGHPYNLFYQILTICFRRPKDGKQGLEQIPVDFMGKSQKTDYPCPSEYEKTAFEIQYYGCLTDNR
jgi:hypothetical protein